ncbi:AbrB/MazE/SpoVT family DNA-binding domain-containing protein [Patescibacteria group bacterium]|nr:AbrB/MazE/SpoVT family DNA-binding domain-containing protein [Patescibacteria group bacterium]
MEKDREEEFLANICQGGRVTVPLAYRERLSLKQGTRVRIRIRKDEA